MRTHAFTLVAAVLLLAGCAAEPESTPTPTSVALGRASTIEQVRDAFIHAGGVCNWEQTDQVIAATASGECSDSTVIMLFDDRADRETVVSGMQSLRMEDRRLTLLVGENWVINSAEAEDMQTNLGGEWVME